MSKTRTCNEVFFGVVPTFVCGLQCKKVMVKVAHLCRFNVMSQKLSSHQLRYV